MTDRVRLDDGVEIAVRVVEPAGSTGGVPLVWGHGLSSSMEAEDEAGLFTWDRAARDRRLVRYDARGHGRSDSSGDLDAYRWDRLADDQLAVADARGVGPYVAAGASMGCATALFAALRAPDRIRAMVLVIPPTAWETRRAQVDVYSTTADLLDAGRIDVLVAGVSASPTPDPFVGQPDYKARARDRLRAADPARLSRVFRGAALADLPPPEDIATIDRPALILAWTGDSGHPISTAERLDELLPRSTMHVATSADELATWTERVADFLAEHGGDDPSIGGDR